MTISGLLGFLLFIIAPCVIAVWLGTRLRRPLIAFTLAWLLTPILTLVVEIVFWRILRALIPPNNDGTGAIMLPFFGIVTGIIAGGVSAIIVVRRKNKVAATQSIGNENGTPLTNTEQSGEPEPRKTLVVKQ